MFGNNSRGFTLIELVVAIGVAGIAIGVAVSAFVFSGRAERRELRLTRLAEETNAAMDFMVRELRTGTINYSAMGVFKNPAPAVAYSSAVDGAKMTVGQSSDPSDCGAAAMPCLIVRSLLTGTTRLASADTRVTSLLFYVLPTSSPGAQAQTVTIILALADSADKSLTYRLQSAVTLRNYANQ